MIYSQNILLLGVLLFAFGVIIGWIIGKYIRPTYAFVMFVGVFWVVYTIYTTETGKEIGTTFDWVGAACTLQMLGIEIGLVAKTAKDKIEQAKDIYSKINSGKK